MENAKRGFVFYFDNYFVVEDLPPDQRGWLLSALCVYAERVLSFLYQFFFYDKMLSLSSK